MTRTAPGPALEAAAAEHVQTLPTELLLAIARGELDPVALAKSELASRGLSILSGKWIGFEAAADLAKGHIIRSSNGRLVVVSVPESEQ